MPEKKRKEKAAKAKVAAEPTKETVLVLEVISKAHKGKQFEVGPKGANLSRKGLSLMYYKATGQIQFPEDEDRISHKHATISKSGDGPEDFSIVDTGSLNGTWLDGERLSKERATSEPHRLVPGSVLNVGTYDFRVSYKEVESKGRPPKKLADRRSAGVQKWRRWFTDTTAHLDKGGSARDLPARPGTIPTKQIKLSELREDQLDIPVAFRDPSSMAARARESLGLSTDRRDAPVRAKSSVYDRLMPNTSILTKVVASTVMHNKIREEEDWEKEVYGGGRPNPANLAPQVGARGAIGHDDILMQEAIASTRQEVESELEGSEHPNPKRHKVHDEGVPAPHPPPLSELPAPPSAAAWAQHQAPSGHYYWYNSETGVSQWEPPPMIQ